MARVLITGGTGSFGRAMARHMIEQSRDSVCIYSRNELKQHEMRQEFGHTDRQRLHMFIGDVRDLQRLRRAFEGVDLVIHAAALKRIEVGHYNPTEMAKTNIMGTMNVIEAAQDAGVHKVIGLSTDKAFQPISAYGISKAMLEALLLAANNTRGASGPRYAVTRYGNVAGSNGSVIPTWKNLLAAGEPITMTHPDCTRFWMTMQQAVDLVLKTAKTMQGGELVIPTLPAYRLEDLSQAMGAMHADIRVTGLDPWEKLHESMEEGKTSDHATRLTVVQLRELLKTL